MASLHRKTNKSSIESLSKGVIEIIEIIWYSYQHGKTVLDERHSSVIPVHCLKLSVCVTSKCHQNSEDLNTLSIKVKSNQYVAIGTLLEDGRIHELHKFVQKMQKQIGGSHLTIYLPDAKDTEQIVAASVLFKESSENLPCIEIVNRTFLRRDWNSEDVLIIHLKAVMTLHSVMKEGKVLVDYLSSLKLMNPDILISFLMDGLIVSHLDLGDNKSVMCGNYSLYAEPNICLLRNPASDYVYGKPVFQHSKSRQVTEAHQKEGCGASISCVTCFIPIYENTHSSCLMNLNGDSNITTSHFVQGQAFMQAYYRNGLPFKMTRFLKCVQIQPDSLVSWDEFGMQAKKSKHRCYPYNLTWSVRINLNTSCAHEMTKCKQFLLCYCFIVDKKEIFEQSDDAPSLKNLAEALQECADSCMKSLFIKDQEQPYPKTQTQSHGDNEFDYWIPDIAASLEEIFRRSTNAEFRIMFGQYVQSDTCMKDHLETSLRQVIRPSNDRIFKEKALLSAAISHMECSNGQDNTERKEIPQICLTPDAMICHTNEDVFTPDSLNEDDYDDIQRETENFGQAINDVEHPINCEGNFPIPHASQSNLPAGKTMFINEINLYDHEIPFKTFCANSGLDTNQNPPQRVSLSCPQAHAVFNSHDDFIVKSGTFANLTQAENIDSDKSLPLDLDDFNSEDSLEIITETVSQTHGTGCSEKSSEEKNRGSLVKKRSFEESQSSVTVEKFETDLDIWTNLEDDLDQMKKLRLCDIKCMHQIEIFGKDQHKIGTKTSAWELSKDIEKSVMITSKDPDGLDTISSFDTLYVDETEQKTHLDSVASCRAEETSDQINLEARTNNSQYEKEPRASEIRHEFEPSQTNIVQVDQLKQPHNMVKETDTFLSDTQSKDREMLNEPWRDADVKSSTELDCLQEQNILSTEGIEDCADKTSRGPSSPSFISENETDVDEEDDWFDSKKIKDWYESLHQQ